MKLPRFSTAILFVILGAAIPAHATQYFSANDVLKSFFKSSPKVSYKPVSLSDQEAADIGKALGTGPVKKDWSVYVGVELDGKRRSDGFALLDHELGMHEPIDFAVRFSPQGAVSGVEVMEYREAYGDEIRAERFRTQFMGKTASDPITAGKDIQIISGASISSRSMAIGVKRGALVLDRALKNGSL